MRYAVSDIHGNLDLFLKLLKKIKFSKDDRIYILGDLIDKGDQSFELVRFVFNELKDNAVLLAGNHEYNFSKYMKNLYDYDLDNETLLEKAKTYLNAENDISFSDIENLMYLPYFIEEDDFILVHAGIPIDEFDRLKPINRASKEELVYDRSFKEPSYIPDINKCVVFGHTPTTYVTNKPEIIKYQRPNTVGDKIKDYYKIHIDTGNYLTGVLGAINLDTLETIYVK